MRDFYELQRQWSAAWDEAERVSFASGYEFTDRHGRRQNVTEDNSHCGRALARWVALRREGAFSRTELLLNALPLR